MDYATSDELREVLTPDYFGSMCRQMRIGDMVLVGTRPQPSASPWRSSNGETRRVLLMVNDVDPGGIVRVRVVQDYGRPEDPDAPLAEPSRKRGRPPKVAGAGQDSRPVEDPASTG